MDLKRLVLGLGILASCTLGASAQADILTIGDSTSFNFATLDGLYDRNSGVDADDKPIFTSNTQHRNLTLDRFDASLGTLLDVDIWFESEWSLGSRVSSVDPRNNKTASARGRSASKQRIRLIDPFKEVAANNEVLWSSCNDTSSCSASALSSGLFNDSFDLGAFSLADFIGSDALDFRVVRILESDLRRCGAFDFCAHENFNNAWSGTLHVNYTYSVPEPATLALMGLGLVGLGAGRLRRFKA